MNSRRKADSDRVPDPLDGAGPAAEPKKENRAPLDPESRRLLGSAANYLSASAFLLQDPPQQRDDALCRLDRAELLVREAVDLLDLIKRRER